MSHIVKWVRYHLGILLFLVIVTPAINGCGQDNEFSPAKARNMIHKNIFLNQDRFPVKDPKAYQYGTIHVDGPTGGILYRFGSNPEALKWITTHHRLQEISIDSMDLWPPDHIDAVPTWWQSPSENVSTCFVKHGKFDTGGEGIFILIFSPSNIFYVVEHFSNMPGV